ncbi:MAG: ribonuclease D [Oligosphaeraceae bacterium]
MQGSPLWIADDASFQAFVASLPAGKPVALDTEFEWTRTYFPILALLQIGLDRENVALVDPLAIRDWSPLARLLADPERQKIFFSGANDMPLLHRVCGVVPASLFDVQVAAGFCGEGACQSLKAVLENRLGVCLPKTESRSDWMLRPLTEKQLGYAGDDVAYLPEVAADYQEALKANGNLAWFQEEMEESFCREEGYRLPPPEDAWRRLGFLHFLRSAPERRRAVSLAIWREKKARETDCARGRLLSDDQLQWCATENPGDASRLLQMPSCWCKRVKPLAGEILEALANPCLGSYQESASQPYLSPERKVALRKLGERVRGIATGCARHRQIEPTLVCTRGEAEAWAFRKLMGLPQEGRICRGWRKELLQEPLRQLEG